MAWRVSRALVLLLLLLLWLGGLVGTAPAALEVRQFDTPLMQQRYDDLLDNLRCPKCENQAIGDSNSLIAGDMRERVAQLLEEGRSDREVQDYMVRRFGDYVLYNPRLSGRTWLLWGLPAGLVVLGALVIGLIVRVRRRTVSRALDATERERLDTLINRERRQ